MKLKLLNILSAAILATAAFADPIDVAVTGSDPSSEPCTPTQRTDEYGTQHFADDVSQSQGKSFDAVLFGDSITDFWVYSNLSFDGDATKTINMGIGSDRVQHLLWRVRNGALDGYAAEYFTLLIGVNNGYQKHVDNHSDPCDRAEDVAEGIRLVLKEIATKHPDAKILLMPILPYGFDSRYYPALDVRNVNEDINDIIIKFVDYKRVFWVDLRSQYLNPDATCKASVFGGPGGNYDAVGHYLHPHTDSYPVIWKPALTGAMQRYRAVAAGQPHVAEPSVGYASEAQYGYDGSATITVRGILTGTDANAVPVESYSISYKLDDGPWTVALQDQSRAVTRASFAIPDVALGDHTCQVKVTTADDKELSTSVDFTMYDGWTGAPLPSDDSAVRTDGTLAYAYACGNYSVNGVPFSGTIDGGNISWPFSSTSGSQAPSSVASGAYRDLLNHCWWANAGEKEVTLKSLTPGHSYLVQIFGYRDYSGHEKSHVWIKESYRDENYMKILGDGWTCGGALTGVFTATESTKAITVCGDNNWAVNGIQVRDLGESGVPVVVQPKIGSVSVSTNATAATVFLSGIVMGTDDAGTNATSYAVSYSLNDAAAVEALSGQSGATASFAIENLADGEYTCVVTITTDKGKTSAAKSVSFRIGTPPPEVVEPSIGSASATTSGDTATVSLSGVVMGTDDEGVAASSYSVSYSLTNAPAETVLQNQAGASASFQIADLADGSYACLVTITTDKGKTSAAKSVSFTISTSGGGSVEAGWTAAPLGATSASIRTDGTLLYAYAREDYTVNGVAFAAEGTDGIDNANCTLGITHDASNTPPGDTETGGYRNLLGKGWYASAADRTLTLRNLEAGKQYLVQIIASRSDFTTQSATAPDGVATIKFGGTGWEYGGSLTGVFTAEGATQEFTIRYAGNSWLNGIQVRDLGAGGGATVVEPSIGSVSATTNGTTATIALSGVVMGTVDEGTNATSYAVAYSLNGGAAVEALAGQSGATASFDIANLADGDYTCAVTITTDKNKTSAEKSVSFTIDTTPVPPVVEPSIGSVSATTNGTTATISLSGVAMGTDDAGADATSYSVSYSLNGGAAVEALAGQSGATASFDIANLADGSYACAVTITTDAGKTASKSVSFAIGSTPPPPDTGWTSEAMDDGGLAFSTEGDLLYAYSLQGKAINGIPFSKANPIVTSDGIAFDPDYTAFDGNLGNEGVSNADFGLMLGNAWCWEDTSTNPKTVTLVLKRLTPGHRYLVQILSHKTGSGMLVSAGGCEPQSIATYGALLTGVFTASAETQDVAITFSGSTSKRPVNAVQVRDLGEEYRPVVEPSIGSVSAAVSGSTATIVLGGVEMGTDAYGTNATSYAVAFALDGGEPVEKLWNQTGRSAWFNVTNLADGAHTVVVTIETDGGGEASGTVGFTIDATSGTATTAWILTEMDAAGAGVRTDGDLLYAHAPNQATVNGVTFERTPWLSDANFSVSPAEADACWGWMMNEGISGYNGYGYLLGHAWYWDATVEDVGVTITLEGLTPGKNYLVQLFSHNWSEPDMRFSVEGSDGHPVGTRTEVGIQDVYVPYRYGTSAVGIFTASSATQTFTVAWTGSTGSHPLNALQVRDLGLAVPVVVEPSIGAASAAVDGSTAVVTLSGVVKGTGDDCEPASSYSVTYVLDGGDAVTVLEDRTGATAAFALAGLADGDHVCVVSIATDKGKTSEAKTVRFEIGSNPFEWKTEPMDPDGETICTNGVRVWAYCRGADGGQVTANGVSFTSYEDLDATRLAQKEIRLPFSVSPAMLLHADDWGDEGVAGGLGKILDNAFYADSDGSRTFTLSGLKADHTYLVQLVMHRSGSGAKATSPLLDIADYVQFGQPAGDPDDTWKYGGSLIGTFLATGETHTFTVDYDGGFSAFNAIQLRDLGVTVATESDPSIGSVSAVRKGTTATVTLAGVEMGTDANRHPATSYSVSYSLDGCDTWTTALTGQNGDTASFVLKGLDYDDHVCEVRITTDANKSSDVKSVTLSFTKADGLAIVYFDVGTAALAFDMGSAEAMAEKLPTDAPIYCTLVTSTNLADVVWTPAQPSRDWKANVYPADDERGWTWCDGLDTDAPARFFRIAVTPMRLTEDEDVVFK